ncbi:hypothetical protein ABPS01_04070 [Streptococcus sp. ZJ151]
MYRIENKIPQFRANEVSLKGYIRRSGIISDSVAGTNNGIFET